MAITKDELPKRPTVVTLCGSTRFMEAFNEARRRESLAGKIVLGVEIDTKQERAVDPQHSAPAVKEMLDELHLRKIDLSDEVLILNVGGYIGESTRRELLYAFKTGKNVRFLDPDSAPARPAPYLHLSDKPDCTRCGGYYYHQGPPRADECRCDDPVPPATV